MIEVTHQIAFHTFLQYRRQLEHIAYEDDLLATEGQRRAQRLAHRVVDSVNDVAAHHRHLVYDDGVRMEQRQDSRLIHLAHRPRYADIHRQAEERVDSVATRKDSCYTGRSQCDKLLVHHLLHLAKKGCLTRSCTSGKEETAVRIGNQLVGEHLLLVLLVECVLHNYRCSSFGRIWVKRVLKSGSRKLL